MEKKRNHGSARRLRIHNLCHPSKEYLSVAISEQQHHSLGFFLSLEVGRNVGLVRNEHFSARRPLSISQYKIIKKKERYFKLKNMKDLYSRKLIVKYAILR